MTDDIVTRLRSDVPFWINELGIEFEVMSEAADEIERLRSKYDRLLNHMQLVSRQGLEGRDALRDHPSNSGPRYE